jgi:hypothetical protein
LGGKKGKAALPCRRGASPRPIEDSIYFDDEGEYAWVRIADVTASERYLEATTQRLSKLGKAKSVAIEPGELFLSIAATVGKPIITKIKCCIHDGFVYFVGLSVYSMRQAIEEGFIVADDGAIVGTERDRLDNDDKFMLHLAQVVRNGLGDRAGTCIDPKTQIVQDKTVCVVSCQRSPEPVFLKWKGMEVHPDGDFFVRSGPGTVKLPPESAKAFIRTRFSGSAAQASGERGASNG